MVGDTGECHTDGLASRGDHASGSQIAYLPISMTLIPEPLGGERRAYIWRGHRIAYTVLGSGPPLLLVHSIHAAAWSMEWRFVAPALAEQHTVYAIDLLGFGASDRPALHYTSALYVELLRDFLREVIGVPAVAVGSSLGGTYLVRIAAESPELVRALCVIGPAGVSRLRHSDGAVGAIGSVVQGLFRAPVIGERLFGAITSRASIRFFLKDIYANPAAMTPEAIELYWQGAHAQGARFAPAAFVGMRLNLDIVENLRQLVVPTLLVWGKDASQTPFSESPTVRAVRPDIPFAALPGGDLPHDESPAAFLDALGGFLRVHAAA